MPASAGPIRRCVRLALAIGTTCATLVTLASGDARADRNDLQLLNLCTPHSPGVLRELVSECSWVNRNPAGVIQGITPDPEAETRFRTLMSELGVAMAPRLVVPADTLGFSGFQVSAELGMTSISNGADHWNGVAGVSPSNTRIGRPDAWLKTAGLFVRKGVWLPLPAMEVGAGVVNLLESRMTAVQGYAKLGLHEGFHDWPIPSLAARVGISHLMGTDQVRMDVMSFDVLVSKAFGLLGTARLEPFGGWSYLWIKAKSRRFDLTPSCDAYAVSRAGSPAPIGGYCADAQVGTTNDFAAYYAFPEQDAIIRHRFFGGLKMKLAWFFLVAQYELVPKGKSRDEQRADGARDTSAKQDAFHLSGGFDF